MGEHPIPAKGLFGRVYSEPRGGSVPVVTGIRVGGHPVLVLPCDENGETHLHELLREARDALEMYASKESYKQGDFEVGECLDTGAPRIARTTLVHYDNGRVASDAIARIDAAIGGK